MSHLIRGGLMLALCLTFSTTVWAQEEEGFSPSNKELDKDLDDALEEEYVEPESEPEHTHTHDDTIHDHSNDEVDDDDRFRFRLGGLAAIMYTELYDVSVSYREGASGGGSVELNDWDGNDDDDDDGFELSDTTGHYRAWFDLGKHVSLTGGFRQMRYQDQQTLSTSQTPGAFSFGRSTFQTGDLVEATFKLMTADMDLVFKPINNRWITIELAAGARYIKWSSRFERQSGGTYASEESNLEMVLPMIGVGLELRPVKILTLFGRFRIGHLSYERDRSYYWDDDDDRYREIEAKEKEGTSFEADVGLSLVFEETFGVIVGYRIDGIELERIVDARSESAEARAHGAYAGFILQF